MTGAACRGRGNGDFFPPAGEFPARRETQAAAMAAVARAKAVCSGCSVREECLAYATERCCDGVWGGTTADERARMGARSTDGRTRRARREEAVRLVGQGVLVADVASQLGITPRSVYRHLEAAGRPVPRRVAAPWVRSSDRRPTP